MRFYFLLFILSHFFASECWAKGKYNKSSGRTPSSKAEELFYSVREDLNLSIPLPQTKSRGGYYEVTPRSYIDVNYKHLEFERSFGLGFTISY